MNGQRRQKHHVLANRQSEEIAEHLGERRHRDQPLVIDHALVALRRHPACDLGGAEDEQDEPWKTSSGMMAVRAASAGFIWLRTPMELARATMNPAISTVMSKEIPKPRSRSRDRQ